jgi:regulatory protein YycI of two-component signal transduction system YycFG
MSELNNADYKKILEYYQKPIPKSKRLLKDAAEKIMSEKLCRCIKKVDKENEARAIGICTKTIFNKKGYTRGKFNCKGKSTVKFNKTLKNIK